jgi:hypothetical protein
MSKKSARMTRAQLKRSSYCIKEVCMMRGSQRKAAIELKILPQNITHWIHKRYFIPVNHVFTFVEWSLGKFQPCDFRPDVFPDFNKKVDVTKV